MNNNNNNTWDSVLVTTKDFYKAKDDILRRLYRLQESDKPINKDELITNRFMWGFLLLEKALFDGDEPVEDMIYNCLVLMSLCDTEEWVMNGMDEKRADFLVGKWIGRKFMVSIILKNLYFLTDFFPCDGNKVEKKNAYSHYFEVVAFIAVALQLYLNVKGQVRESNKVFEIPEFRYQDED